MKMFRYFIMTALLTCLFGMPPGTSGQNITDPTKTLDRPTVNVHDS